jgi:hypothetical protein
MIYDLLFVGLIMRSLLSGFDRNSYSSRNEIGKKKTSRKNKGIKSFLNFYSFFLTNFYSILKLNFLSIQLNLLNIIIIVKKIGYYNKL